MGHKGVQELAVKRTPSRELCFLAYLRTRLAESPPKQKGLRTRERLKISTAQLLQEHGYHALKAGHVTAHAGFAEGSFYMYFTDKADATRTVLQEFLTEFAPAMMRPAASRSPFEAICETNRRWIALARANDGLFRCLLQFSDSDPDFAAFVQTSNRDWYTRVLKSLPAKPEPDAPTLLLLIYLLGAMMDDLLRKLVIYPDQQLRALLDGAGATDADVADAASVLWLRVLYGAVPEADQLSPMVRSVCAIIDSRAEGPSP